MLGYHEFLFFHSSFIYVLIWQIFSSYYEYSTMLYSGEAYELRIIYWECKDASYTLLGHRKPSAGHIDHSTTMHYEVKMCLKYFWCSLYSSNTEKLLYSGHQVLAELRVLGKTDMSSKGQLPCSMVNAKRVLPAECSGLSKGTPPRFGDTNSDWQNPQVPWLLCALPCVPMSFAPRYLCMCKLI